MQEFAGRETKVRIELLDILRGIALIAMAVYHFTWDLEFFGYLPQGYAQVGGWRLFARGIAISFLVLVGIGLFLAHGRAIRWPAFRKRLGQIVAGAAAITVATYFFTPQSFVFFGILHLIALASILGLVFLRVPAAVTILAALATIVLPALLSTDLTNTRWLAWIGFSARPVVSNDFVPLFPWFAPVLVGIAAGQLLDRFGILPRLADLNPSVRPARPLAALGRHSLLFYLLHQPISIALVAAFAYVMPPDQSANFVASCQQTCANDRDAAFCERYCGCVLEDLKTRDLLAKLLSGELNEGEQSTVRETVTACSFSSER